MNLDELRDNRFCIVITALKNGLEVPYKRGWRLWYWNTPEYKYVCQVFRGGKKNEERTHRSAVTLTDFMNFIQELSDKELKQLHSNNQLRQLQKRLENEE
jgi:hypothetical protein